MLPSRSPLVRGLAAVVLVGAVFVAVGGASWQRARNVELPLRGSVVALTVDGPRLLGEEAVADLVPGTRVLLPDDADAATTSWARQAALAQREWLAAGHVPGQGTAWEPMVRDALLDLHVLTGSQGAVVASWPRSWRYVWPRDAAFAAVAFARTGHLREARSVLTFLQGVQRADGLFEARYRRDGTVPDTRGVQLDGTGWALWAAGQVIDTVGPDEHAELLSDLRPLLTRASAAAVRLVSGRSGLPPASADFWELPEERLTLGTASPLLAGLGAATNLWRAAGDVERASTCAGAASRLRSAIRKAFGPDGYPRHVGGDELDAAVSFLLPPFVDKPQADVLSAWRQAQVDLLRPAGGLAPGAGWPSDGVSWTPSTALFALTAAGIGDRQTAATRLHWLFWHRTSAGALPEKVLHDGSPAEVAPLAWTCALVVLTADLLDDAAAGPGPGGQ
jgi:GH15 family glucan-1,4-alpha-glucosidase